VHRALRGFGDHAIYNTNLRFTYFLITYLNKHLRTWYVNSRWQEDGHLTTTMPLANTVLQWFCMLMKHSNILYNSSELQAWSTGWNWTNRLPVRSQQPEDGSRRYSAHLTTSNIIYHTTNNTTARGSIWSAAFNTVDHSTSLQCLQTTFDISDNICRWYLGTCESFFFAFESNLESNRPSDSFSNRIFESNRAINHSYIILTII